MDRKEVYKIWAPFNKKWTEWVRPVSFMTIGPKSKEFRPSHLRLPELFQLCTSNTDMAIIVDLPDTKSVEIGILLAKEYGYRPIPIYNGVIEQANSRATTNNTSISDALIWGSSILSTLNLRDDALPAFLTDTNRLQRHQMDSSIFDNSWDVYHQDLPPEEYFLKNGITKILVISDKLSRDLKKIFAGYPEKKIEILLSNGYEETKWIKKRK